MVHVESCLVLTFLCFIIGVFEPISLRFDPLMHICGRMSIRYFCLIVSLCHTSQMFLHIYDNCKQNYSVLSVSNEVCSNMLQDIIGSFLRQKEGTVDMDSVAELHDKFHSLKSKWAGQDRHQWFMETKLSAV